MTLTDEYEELKEALDAEGVYLQDLMPILVQMGERAGTHDVTRVTDLTMKLDTVLRTGIRANGDATDAAISLFLLLFHTLAGFDPEARSIAFEVANEVRRRKDAERGIP